MSRLVIVVPARGGSKRVPGKNIHPLNGRPLLTYTLVVARQAALDAPIIVSTDDDGVAAVAEQPGIRVIRRPPDLATDTASTEAALLHVLDTLDAEGSRPDWVMTLPPTSPLRSAATIRIFAEEVVRRPDDQDCLMSVTENRGDFWLWSEIDGWRRLFPDAPRRQQDRTPLYEENSAVYVTKVGALRATGSILGRSVRCLVVDPVEGFDINTRDDFHLAEALIKARSETAFDDA